MTSIVTVYATFSNAEEAERVGRMVVEERLAACINVLGPCRSIYRWQGNVETADEVAAVFKTNSAQAEALVARIAALHSYEEPAIAVWPILGSTDGYAAWVEESVG